MASAEILDPETAPTTAIDEPLYEIVNGQMVEQPPMGADESRLAFRLASKIDQLAERGGLGQAVTETLFRLQSRPNLQRRPDAAFVSTTRWPRGRRIPRGNAWDVIPDLAVEVISPTNLAEEVPTKVREYFEAGVRRVWVVYPHESLVYEYDSPRSIRVLGLDDALEGGEIIPGFRLALADLFEGAEDAGPAPTS